MDPENDDYYFKEELLNDKHIISLLPYRSVNYGIYPSDISTEVALRHSIQRLQVKILKGLPVDGSFGGL